MVMNPFNCATLVPEVILPQGNTAVMVILKQKKFCSCTDCKKTLNPGQEVVCVERKPFRCKTLKKFYFCSVKCQRYDFVTRRVMIARRFQK
jgi:hypothetical protein